MNWRPFFLLLLLTAFTPVLRAQYAFDEFGLGFGAGAELLYRKGNQIPAASLNLNADYSHYICGKAYGYQFGAALRGMYGRGNQSVFSDIAGADLRLAAAQAELMVLGKIKTAEKHTRHELAFAAGPKLALVPWSRFSESGLDYGSALPAAGSWIQPGLHLSAMIRRPFGNKKSMIFEPAFNYYFQPVWFQQPVSTGMGRISLYLNIVYNLWESRG